jgi:hypothetical protein
MLVGQFLNPIPIASCEATDVGAERDDWLITCSSRASKAWLQHCLHQRCATFVADLLMVIKSSWPAQNQHGRAPERFGGRLHVNGGIYVRGKVRGGIWQRPS